MARKSKKTSSIDKDIVDESVANPSEEFIEDVIEVTDEGERTFDELTEDAQSDSETIVEEAIEEAEVVDAEHVAEDIAAEAEEVIEETVEDIVPETPPAPAPEQVVVKKGGFFPLLFGGLIAGGIGYGAAYMQNQGGTDYQPLIDGQAAEIAALKEQVASMPPPADLAPLQGQVEEVSTELANAGEAFSDLGAQLGTVVERVDALERRPNEDGTLADSALAAFESDIQSLRDQIVEQQSEMQTMAETAAQQLQATRDEAVAIEETAVATARKATARTVLAQIQSAADTGAPLGALLTDLGGALEDPVPEALESVADGVPTLASLQESFPDFARAALSTARQEGVSGESGSGFTSFLKNQFDVRSTAASDGDSADAVLSRAEASLRTGMLNDTLAEVSALPEVARAALSDWTAQAELRAAALDAIAQLSDTLNIN